MPTGYTADIADGITFKQFAMRCARAFGALILMRDDPMNAPIPDEFKPSDWHGKELAKAKGRQIELLAITLEQAAVLAKKDYTEAEARRLQMIADNKALKAKYEAMLVQVRAWTPPSADHIELRSFMEQQITESIRFDCGGDWLNEPTKLLSAEAWLADRLKKAEDDIKYHVKELAAEQERAASRTRWVRQLRESL